MQVLANLDESDVGRIRPGQHVTFRVDAYPADDFQGTVAQVRLQPIIQQNVVTYATVIDVPNPELKLKPGMTANVNVEIARRAAVLRVPNTTLRFRPTNDMYAAFGQTPPPGGGRGEGSGGAGRNRGNASGTGATAPAAAPATSGPVTADGGSGARPARADGGSTVPPRDGEVVTEGDRPRRGTGEGGSPEAPGAGRRERAKAELQSLPPEERARMLERMKARGFDPTAPGAADAVSGPGARGDGRGAKNAAVAPKGEMGRGGAGASAQSLSARNPRATTIDALFGPLQTIESVGRVWVFVDSQLKPMRVRLGITDGQVTELIQGEGIEEGTELVTNVTTGNESTRPAATGGFPFMGPQPGRFGGPGGFPGGGGNRGGGGGR
jgi:hypothetical protein